MYFFFSLIFWRFRGQNRRLFGWLGLASLPRHLWFTSINYGVLTLLSSVRTGQHVCHRSFTSFLSYYSLTVTDSLLTHSVLQPSQRPRTKAGENWTTGICTGRFGSAGGVTRSTKAIRWIETCSDLFSSLTHAVVAHRSIALLSLPTALQLTSGRKCLQEKIKRARQIWDCSDAASCKEAKGGIISE